jgi:hypothetical protein
VAALVPHVEKAAKGWQRKALRGKGFQELENVQELATT